ncbi:MAG TPA: HAMP domain-containing sensor histidine kinase [Solirubrobacteraceae bacterium]|nr:HAMP domain-containing sensor histidine kinase [Solirubrobacteraceae bacterium]
MTRRVAVASIAVVTVVMLLVGGAMYIRFAVDLRDQVDDELRSLIAHPAVLLSRPGPDELAQLRGAGGAVRAQTPALEQLGTLPALGIGYASVSLGGAHLRTYTRAVAGRSTLTVAEDLGPTRRTLLRVRRELIVGSLVGAALAALALVVVTRRALLPVREVADLADHVAHTSDLRERAPETADRDEIGRLTRSMNRMLDRLEASDGALRRLVGDASHELRTPLTALRGNLDLLTDGTPLDPTDRAAALGDAHAETRRLQAIVENLLTLARADAVPLPEAVRVADLFDEVPAEHVRLGPATDGLWVTGDASSLRSLVRNLVENGERHGGGVSIEVDGEPDAVVLRFVDHGPGIAPGERERIFERFHRAPGQQASAGSGIGLAIVRTVARSHGGEVTVQDTDGGGATFAVRLPLARSSRT